MIKIISFGDRITEGNYKIHSGFKNYLNLVCRNKLITITDRREKSGPVNIVLSELPELRTQTITIRKNEILLNCKSCSWENYQKFDSQMHLNSNQFSTLINRIDLVENYLKENGSEASLKYLLDDRLYVAENSFQKILKCSIQQGVLKFLNGQVAEGIKQIKGKGIGLTPSGDDLITGILYGLNLLQSQGFNLKELKKTILNNSQTGNLISRNYICLAQEGSFFNDLKQLVLTLATENDEELTLKTADILRKGETSGADMLTGFILTLQKKELLCNSSFMLNWRGENDKKRIYSQR